MTQHDAQDSFAALAHRRHSCRAFRKDPIPRDRIKKLLEIAQRAPSDCNSQSWTTYLLSGPVLEALRDALSAHVAADRPTSADVPAVERYEGTLLERRRACGWALYEAVGVTKGDRAAARAQAMENFRFFGAPHLALITVETSMGQRGIFDAGIYAGLLLLAAEALRIAAVPQASVTHYADLIRHHVPVPPSQLILCAVAFGEEDRAHPANAFRTARAKPSDYVRWLNDYGSRDQSGAGG